MPNWCPYCGGEQRLKVVSANGYSRPLTPGDRRQRRTTQFDPNFRNGWWEPVGRLEYHYVCTACDAVVVPGGGKWRRNWRDPDNWIEVNVVASRMRKWRLKWRHRIRAEMKVKRAERRKRRREEGDAAK